MADVASTDANIEHPAARSRALTKVRAIVPVLAVLSIAAALFVGVSRRWNDWVADSATQQTDDAQIRADVTPLSTKSSGIVAVVAVTDFQRVKAGQLLVQLKDDDFRAQVDLAQAAVEAAEAALVNLASQRVLQSSRIAAARANLDGTRPDVERAGLELARERTLESAQVSTRQRLEIVTADYGRFVAAQAARRAELDAQRKQVAVIDTQQKQLEAELAAKRAALRVAEVNLEYTRIVAPTAGVVSERKVRPGQLVGAGTQVFSIVGDDVWVIANYREVQVANVHVGGRATVRVDGIPGVDFPAHIDTISPASGAVFSLLPPDNATGNFTKIAQRIPLKLVFDEHVLEQRLRPGMSATVSLRTAQP